MAAEKTPAGLDARLVDQRHMAGEAEQVLEDRGDGEAAGDTIHDGAHAVGGHDRSRAPGQRHGGRPARLNAHHVACRRQDIEYVADAPPPSASKTGSMGSNPSTSSNPMVAALFVADPEIPRRPSEAALVDLFDFTATEASVDTIASGLKVSRNTVHFHLRALFRKSDTARQGELVARQTPASAVVDTTMPAGT